MHPLRGWVNTFIDACLKFTVTKQLMVRRWLECLISGYSDVSDTQSSTQQSNPEMKSALIIEITANRADENSLFPANETGIAAVEKWVVSVGANFLTDAVVISLEINRRYYFRSATRTWLFDECDATYILRGRVTSWYGTKSEDFRFSKTTYIVAYTACSAIYMQIDEDAHTHTHTHTRTYRESQTHIHTHTHTDIYSLDKYSLHIYRQHCDICINAG